MHVKTLAKRKKSEYNNEKHRLENSVCHYYSTNAKSAKNASTSWFASIRIKSFALIAAEKQNGIIRGKCTRQRENRAKNVRETAKRAAVVIKVSEKGKRGSRIF